MALMRYIPTLFLLTSRFKRVGMFETRRDACDWLMLYGVERESYRIDEVARG